MRPNQLPYFFELVKSIREIKGIGMQGKKNDRSAWINNVFEQFLEDFKADRRFTRVQKNEKQLRTFRTVLSLITEEDDLV
jgi:predicted RNA-binding protein YlxR (DUF448 family)